MSLLSSIRAAVLGGPTGPYGEDPFSLIRKNRSLRSRPVDEDRLQGQANRTHMRQECMDLFRVSALARAAVVRIADYATVCMPYPITSSERWNEQAGAFWGEWVKSCDYRRRPGVDLCTMTRIAHIADHVAGESFFVLVDDGTLQPIEFDRIATPDEFKADPLVIDGIRTDVTGRITHYYVCARGKYGAIDNKVFRRIAANNMIHVVEPWRVDMMHGVPRLHAAVRKLADYDETDQAMRGKVKNEAQRFFQTDKQLPFGGPRARTLGTGDNRYRIIDTDIGQVWDGNKVDLIESKSPNSTYTPHMVEEGKAVAASCDIPYEYLMMIFTAGSYNAQKGARLAFGDTCRRRAAFVGKLFHQRTWNWRIAKAIKDGDLPPAPATVRPDGIRRSEWYRVEWGMPRFQDIDLGRDVSAKSAAWAAGQQSLRDQRENPYQVLADKAEDIRRADLIAQKLNKKLGTGQITWQHILNAGVPGMTIPTPDYDAEDTEAEVAQGDDNEES